MTEPCNAQDSRVLDAGTCSAQRQYYDLNNYHHNEFIMGLGLNLTFLSVLWPPLRKMLRILLVT